MNSKKRALLEEIAITAPQLTNKIQSNITLLDLIDTFDQVIRRNNIEPESTEAIDLYKSMLRLGRLNTWKEQLKIKSAELDITSSLYDKDRAPLNNLTNKTKEVVTFRSERIELPKLKLTHLMNTSEKESALATKLEKIKYEPAERECTLNEIIADNYHVWN